MIWTGELSFWRASWTTAANTAAIVATQSAIKATFRALSSGTKFFDIHRPAGPASSSGCTS